MKTFVKILFTICAFFSSLQAEQTPLIHSSTRQKVSRLLICIDKSASFSPQDFANAFPATYIEVNQRNPYNDIYKIFLSEPVVVIPYCFTSEEDLFWVSARYGYRYVVFTNQSLEEAASLAEKLLLSGHQKSSEILPKLSVEEAQQLYSLMEKIDQVFTSHGITYWVGRDTLLGAIRHGGLLPWDDYLSLYILDKEENTFAQVKESLAAVGLEVDSYRKGFYKIYDQEGSLLTDEDFPEKTLPFRYPAANLFVMKLEKKGDLSRCEISDSYVNKSYEFYSHWYQDRFDYSQIENITRVSFGPITVPIPGDPKAYLSRMYGTVEYPDLWEKYTFELPWNHRIERPPLYPGAALVEVDDFSPAPWKK